MNNVELELETPRLLLRPLQLDDIDLAHVTLCEPDVMKFVANVIKKEDLLEKMKSYIKRGAGGCIGIWCVVRKSTSEKLGTSILLPLPVDRDDIDWSQIREDRYPQGEIEIGYILKRAAWGKGYAREACARLLQFGFEQTSLEEIVAVTDPENAASQHVLKKCGFRDEGLRRAYAEDLPGFRISKKDWLALGNREE